MMPREDDGAVTSTDFPVRAADGIPLAATLFAPPPAEGGDTVIVIAGATAVPRGYYARFARHLAAEGFTVLTFDYRGIGGSRDGVDDRRARMSDWGERDLAGILDWALARAEGARVAVVGHSVGGQVLGLAPHAERVSALLAIAAMNPYWGHWPGTGKARMALVWHAALPAFARAFRRVPKWAGLGEELPAGVAREWAWWGRSPLHLFRDDTRVRRAAFARFTGAFAAWSFEDDEYAPRASVDAFFDAYYPNARAISRRHVTREDARAEAVGHFGFFRPRFRDTLWADAVAWLDGCTRDASATADVTET